jgi:hypothetical protein
MVGMIPCPTCNHSHRDEDGLERCRERASRKVTREERKQEDFAQRQAYAKAHPLEEYLVDFQAHAKRVRGHFIEKNLAGASVRVRKLYPPPADWPHECREERCLLCIPAISVRVDLKRGKVIVKEVPREWNDVLVVYVDSWRMNWGKAA